MSARKYYSLLQRVNGKWTIQFGDYDRQVVADVADDMWDQGIGTKRADLKIITTGPKQSDIEAAVAKLNGTTKPICTTCNDTGRALVRPYPGRVAERIGSCPTCSGGKGELVIH